MSSTYYEYLQEKNCLYHWNRAEKQAKALKKGYEEVSSLRIEKYFEWIIEQLLNSAFVWYGDLCSSEVVIHRPWRQPRR